MAEGPGPRARAGNAKDFFEFLETFQPGTQAHLRRVLPPDVLQGLESATRVDWNDVETIDGPYVTAIVSWLGDERARDAWREFTVKRFIHTPAIRALAEGAARLFGVSVGSYVRMIPFAFQQGFRNCGTARVDLGPGEATVRMTFSEGFARFEAYAVLLHGIFLGIFDLARVEARLEFEPSFPERRLVATFRW